jgi:putative ABC transport system permease protein
MMGAPLAEALRLAFESLRASKLRSVLTLTGIILSTATLIAVMSIIRGMDVYVANAASTMGNDGFRVVRAAFTGVQNAKKFFEAQQKNPQLTREEYQFIKERARLVREIGISATRFVQVSYGADVLSGIALQGVTSNSPAMSNTQIDQGRFFTDIEDQRKMHLVFIGRDIKERFFPTVDAVGKTIAIDGLPFEVIGVAQPKGSLFGQSQDNYVSIPVQTYFKIYGDRQGIGYNFQALDRNYLEQAQDEVRALIRAHRRLTPQQDDNFSVISSDSLVSIWDQLTGAIAAVAVAVVSVFMVVGGVVIMNIMLAVVTERTHEIGLRKSVGASRRDIMMQFLFESSMLSGAGGLIGITLAWIIAVLVRVFTPVPMSVPGYSVAIGTGLSTIVGLFFGLYPARKAASLDPVVAMRMEN